MAVLLIVTILVVAMMVVIVYYCCCYFFEKLNCGDYDAGYEYGWIVVMSLMLNPVGLVWHRLNDVVIAMIGDVVVGFGIVVGIVVDHKHQPSYLLKIGVDVVGAQKMFVVVVVVGIHDWLWYG